MRLVPALALAALVSGFATIVLGGYVSAIEAGLACPDWPTCNGALIPDLTNPLIAAEYTHRWAAVLTGVFTLGTLALVGLRHRRDRPLLLATSLAFLLLAVQITLGMITVTSGLAPVFVTAHLGVATGFMVVMTATTLLAFRTPSMAPSSRTRTAEEVSSVTERG